MEALLRLATPNDCYLYFTWANDPLVRENSLNENKIDKAEHMLWFHEKLKSESVLFVLEVNNVPVGQIRYDKENTDTFLIDYSISQENRGKGYGELIINKSIVELSKMGIHGVLKAVVKFSNKASLKALEKNSFKLENRHDSLWILKLQV